LGVIPLAQTAKDTLKSLKIKLKGFVKDKNINAIKKDHETFLHYLAGHENDLKHEESVLNHKREQLIYFEKCFKDRKQKLDDEIALDKEMIKITESIIKQMEGAQPDKELILMDKEEQKTEPPKSEPPKA
jgi:hypothetical protein